MDATDHESQGFARLRLNGVAQLELFANAPALIADSLLFDLAISSKIDEIYILRIDRLGLVRTTFTIACHQFTSCG